MDDYIVELKLNAKNKRLHDARIAKGWRQADLATAIGYQTASVNHWENLRHTPKPEQQELIATALGETVEWLFPPELDMAIKAGVFERNTKALNTQEVEVLTFTRIERLAYSDAEMLDEVDRKLLVGKVASILDDLSPRESRVLELRFGLGNGDGNGSRTLAEVGEILNVSRDGIRQIEQKALRKLRQPARSRHLKEWLD